jgi:uncharacterized membrane protein
MTPRYGREVSRIEGFSDAVFGFALTLLVVSLEVPQDFEALKGVLAGFLPFGAMFAFVCWIWFEHYTFFRKFEAEDGMTIVLNSVLLFLVLFFVYPLKFMLSHVIPSIRGQMMASEQDARLMFLVYSGGFVAMMLMFALLYANQYRQRAVLGLSPEQIFEAGAGARMHMMSVLLGGVSIGIALAAPISLIWTAGAIYFLMGPLHALNGWLTGRARARMLPSSTPERR